jgi:hypothetical protein
VPKQTQGVTITGLRPLVNKQTTNAFWNNNNLKFYEKRNVMRYRMVHSLIKRLPSDTAFPPMQNAPSATAT